MIRKYLLLAIAIFCGSFFVKAQKRPDDLPPAPIFANPETDTLDSRTFSSSVWKFNRSWELSLMTVMKDSHIISTCRQFDRFNPDLQTGTSYKVVYFRQTEYYHYTIDDTLQTLFDTTPLKIEPSHLSQDMIFLLPPFQVFNSGAAVVKEELQALTITFLISLCRKLILQIYGYLCAQGTRSQELMPLYFSSETRT